MTITKIRNILNEMGISEDVSESTLFVENLSMDSTELADLAAMIQREFGVVVDKWRLQDYSIAQLTKVIESKQLKN